MKLIKGLLALVVAASSLIAIGCGGGGGSGTVPPTTTTITTSDFFHLAIVPDQTVSTATFEVQVIAENIDPATSPSAPRVIDGSGASHVMALKTLKWPGTAVDSVTVYSAIIPLVANQVNNIKAVSGTKELPFSIRHKAALNIVHAANSAQLQTIAKDATCSNVALCTPDTSIDVIEVDYPETDLGATLNNVGTNSPAGGANPTTRTTWLTIKPGTGSLTWKRDSSSPLSPRPKMDFLQLDNVVFGSGTSDGGAGQYYVEAGHRVWISGSQFRAKYDATWSKNTLNNTPNGTFSEIRVLRTEGQKLYYTNCSWSGTSSDYATLNAELARDLTFDSHRGDLNRFGKVFLNAVADNIAPVLIPCPTCAAPFTDYTHNDGFQVFGTNSNLVFKGVWIKSTGAVPAELQPFLFDRTADAGLPADYSNILVDSIIIDGAAVSTLKAQFAGPMANSRISNFSFPLQSITLREDFGAASFSPTNVRIHNANVKAVEYINAPSITYTSASVADPLNAAPELNANPGLSGAIFSNIKLN